MTVLDKAKIVIDEAQAAQVRAHCAGPACPSRAHIQIQTKQVA